MTKRYNLDEGSGFFYCTENDTLAICSGAANRLFGDEQYERRSFSIEVSDEDNGGLALTPTRKTDYTFYFGGEEFDLCEDERKELREVFGAWETLYVKVV
jgi:hypothetical protein